MKKQFTKEDLKKAYEAGGNVTLWSDFGFITKWRKFDDWFDEIYIDTCPHCGEIENIHTNVDYSKKEYTVENYLCNECHNFFEKKEII